MENAFHGKTVGPAILPDFLDDPGHLERWIARKDEAASVGWIQDPAVVTSLNQKLEAASAAWKRGSEKAAAGTLRSFWNELEPCGERSA